MSCVQIQLNLALGTVGMWTFTVIEFMYLTKVSNININLIKGMKTFIIKKNKTHF